MKMDYIGKAATIVSSDSEFFRETGTIKELRYGCLYWIEFADGSASQFSRADFVLGNNFYPITDIFVFELTDGENDYDLVFTEDGELIRVYADHIEDATDIDYELLEDIE